MDGADSAGPRDCQVVKLSTHLVGVGAVSHSGFANCGWRVGREKQRSQQGHPSIHPSICKAQPGSYGGNSKLPQPPGKGGWDRGHTLTQQWPALHSGDLDRCCPRTHFPSACGSGTPGHAPPGSQGLYSPPAPSTHTQCKARGPRPPSQRSRVVHTEWEGQAVLLQEPHGVVPAQARELHEGRRADPVICGQRKGRQHL